MGHFLTRGAVQDSLNITDKQVWLILKKCTWTPWCCYCVVITMQTLSSSTQAFYCNTKQETNCWWFLHSILRPYTPLCRTAQQQTTVVFTSLCLCIVELHGSRRDSSSISNFRRSTFYEVIFLAVRKWYFNWACDNCDMCISHLGIIKSKWSQYFGNQGTSLWWLWFTSEGTWQLSKASESSIERRFGRHIRIESTIFHLPKPKCRPRPAGPSWTNTVRQCK